METEAKKGGNVAAIVTMFALFFMIAFVTNFAGSMGVIVKNQFGASNTASQLGSAANFFAYLFMGIPGGLILKRKGYKFTALTAVAVGFAGVGVQLLSGYVSSFAVYVTGAFVAGFSMCMLNLVVNPLLNTLGGEGKKGNQLVQIGCSLNSVGATLAPIILGYLIGGEVAKAKVADAAPALMIAMGLFALAFVIIALSRIPEPHMETAEEKEARLSGKTSVLKDIAETLKFRHFSFGALCIFFYIIIECGIPNMANLYMTDIKEIKGSEVEISAAQANAMSKTILAAAKAKEAALEAAEKAAKVAGKDVDDAKAEVNKKFELKPGQKTEVLKVEKDGKFEKFNPESDKEIAVDAKGKFQKVTCEASESYVGAYIAGLLVGAYWFCMMIGRLVGGAIGGKVSSKVMITICSVAGISLMLASIYAPVKMITLFDYQFPLSMAFVVLCGLCTSVMWGGIFNLAAEGLGKYVPMGSGIFMACVFGGVCLPLQGWIADAVGILNAYWLTIGLFAYVLLYAHVLSKPTKKVA